MGTEKKNRHSEIVPELAELIRLMMTAAKTTDGAVREEARRRILEIEVKA